MKAAEEYLIRRRLHALPRTTKKEAIRRGRKTCIAQMAGMQWGGKVDFKRQSAHPSEADRKEQKLRQARWRAKEGRIKSKNKDIRQIISLSMSPSREAAQEERQPQVGVLGAARGHAEHS